MAAPTEIRCSNCGRASTAADRFCGFCGARLDGEHSTPTGEVTGPLRPHVDRILSSLRAATIGEYDVAGEIGRGGMAVVFLAHDLSLNRKVAIKALLPELLYTEGMDRRFKHEARIAAKLDHPNILVIHGVREANDLLFIVMKLVEGLPLSTIAKGSGPLPVPVVRLIVRHVAEALAYAHGEGVIHRDVKPANIMVDRRGNVVVMDFGIAKAADDSHLTRTGLVIGTPAYMSPEQCLAQAVSAASDQYSLGVVAFELLTGKTPFRGSALEMQWAHATSAPPAVRSLRPDCPPELDALVSRMLAKAPADRWPSLHDVASALGDDAATAGAARSTLITLANAAPGSRDAMLPTTPASPLPFGAGPAAVVDATTDPVLDSAFGPTTKRSPTRMSAGAPNADAASAPAAVGVLTLSQQRIEMTTGDSVELIVELDASDSAADGATVFWESSNASVATVSSDGLVTARSPGLAEIACTWRGKRAVCVVQVTSAIIALPVPAGHTPRAPHATEPAPSPGAQSESSAIPSREPVRTERRRTTWLVGGAAAAIVAVVLAYRALQPEATTTAVGPAGPDSSLATVAAPQAPSAPAPGSRDTATDAAAPSGAAPLVAENEPQKGAQDGQRAAPNAPGARVASSATSPQRDADPARGAASGAGRGASSGTPASGTPASGTPSSGTPSSGTPSKTPQTPPQATAPVVPPTRLDTSRLAANRTDSGSGYAAARPTAPATAPTSGYTTPAPRDSTPERLPAPSRDIATALFREFAATVNSRTYSRMTSAYSQPNDAAEVKLWQEFLVFVRDYTPRTTTRSVTIDTTTSPATITASIDFRWSTDAGYERTRPATFVGYGIPIPDGWQLRGVKLNRKFW